MEKNEEEEVLQKMRPVFGSEEWVEAPGLKAQDRTKVNKEAKVVEQLMHNLGMLVSLISRLLYTGVHVVANRLGLMGKKKGNNFEKKKPTWQMKIEKSIMQWQNALTLELWRRGRGLCLEGK